MSVGWHSDDESLFQGKFRDITIISLSLGVKRKFELRSNWPEAGERSLRPLVLSKGDLMTMEGMVQKHYQHRVPREEGVDGPRINLTWLWIVRHRHKCGCARARPNAFTGVRYESQEVPAEVAVETSQAAPTAFVANAEPLACRHHSRIQCWCRTCLRSPIRRTFRILHQCSACRQRPLRRDRRSAIPSGLDLELCHRPLVLRLDVGKEQVLDRRPTEGRSSYDRSRRCHLGPLRYKNQRCRQPYANLPRSPWSRTTCPR